MPAKSNMELVLAINWEFLCCEKILVLNNFCRLEPPATMYVLLMI